MLTAMDSSLAIRLRHCACGGACPQPPPPLAILSLVVGAFPRFPSRGKWRVSGGGFGIFIDSCFQSGRGLPLSSRVRSSQGDAGSLSDSPRSNSKPRYHPSEEMEELDPPAIGEERCLTVAETARTIIEVNSKATIIFSGFTDDVVEQNIVLPYLPYLTDEHGDIYFEVGNEKEILQTLIADDKLAVLYYEFLMNTLPFLFVLDFTSKLIVVQQVIIGLDNVEMIPELDLLEPADLDFGVEESSSDESTSDEEYEENVVVIHEDEIDEVLSDDISDWTNLETMRSCHPMYFAKKMEESILSDNLDWMDQPPASIVIRGHLRPAFVEENTNIKKIPYSGESDNGRSSSNGAAFYKLEMINIQIVSAYGSQVDLERIAKDTHGYVGVEKLLLNIYVKRCSFD